MKQAFDWNHIRAVLATAETVMNRRRVELTPSQKRLLEAAWDAARG